MTNPTPHGQVPEALIDLIDAYAETRHRCGGIYNAKTEAARKAVIEALSGVQALSAAPAGPWSLGEMTGNWRDIDLPDHGAVMRIVWKMEDDEGRNERLEAQAHAVVAALNAASPTPPAEQQATKAAPGEPVASAAKDAIMGAAYDFRDAHISGSMNLKRSAHAILEAAVDSALAAQAAPQQEAQEPCPSCKNSDIYACTCPFPTSRNTAPQPAPAPLSRERVKEIMRENGYDGASAQHRADFINGVRHAEIAHGISAALVTKGDTP